MKSSILLPFIICFIGLINAQTQQPTLDTKFLQKHTSYFTIENNNVIGEGKSVLESIANESQFVVYGEMHGSEQTSILNKAFIPILAEAGFKHFAIEVGPHSAAKLAELSIPAKQTVENLKTFNSKYTVDQGGEVAEPIPFFTSVSDAEFLQEARIRNMDLWGLDQEFYFSAFFLMDELTKTAEGTSNYEKIVQLQNQAKPLMFQHFVAEFKEEIESAYELIIKEQSIKDYFAAFEKSNTKAQTMIKDMTLSWDIYINWRNDSHVNRISYMRQNFMNQYNKATKAEKRPKVFTKIGGLHAKKTISNGAYDIGELTESLAQKKWNCCHIYKFLESFSKDDEGNIINNFERYKRGYKRYTMFFPLAKENEFTIIDLKSIRKAIDSNTIKLPEGGEYHKLRSLIYGYDYHIILPADETPIPNR